MGKNYQYLDLQGKYVDSNGVLYNKANLKNEKVLLAYESMKTGSRLEELYIKPIKVINSQALLNIHHHIFQDVYEWAGQVRTVNISKEGKDFIALPWFSRAFSYIDNLVAEFFAIAKNDKPALAQKLAEILDNVNYLHPFRDGNGRVQREFIRSLALEKGLVLVLNPPDDETVFQRYMEGTIQGSVATLSGLILELISLEPGISQRK